MYGISETIGRCCLKENVSRELTGRYILEGRCVNFFSTTVEPYSIVCETPFKYLFFLLVYCLNVQCTWNRQSCRISCSTLPTIASFSAQCNQSPMRCGNWASRRVGPTALPTFTVDPVLMDSQAILYSLQATVVAELVPKTKMFQSNIT